MRYALSAIRIVLNVLMRRNNSVRNVRDNCICMKGLVLILALRSTLKIKIIFVVNVMILVVIV